MNSAFPGRVENHLSCWRRLKIGCGVFLFLETLLSAAGYPSTVLGSPPAELLHVLRGSSRCVQLCYRTLDMAASHPKGFTNKNTLGTRKTRLVWNVTNTALFSVCSWQNHPAGLFFPRKCPPAIRHVGTDIQTGFLHSQTDFYFILFIFFSLLSVLDQAHLPLSSIHGRVWTTATCLWACWNKESAGLPELELVKPGTSRPALDKWVIAGRRMIQG